MRQHAPVPRRRPAVGHLVDARKPTYLAPAVVTAVVVPLCAFCLLHPAWYTVLGGMVFGSGATSMWAVAWFSRYAYVLDDDIQAFLEGLACEEVE